ncbi:FAD-dependent oxidoreductase [Sphingopyxis sp. JAI128]|uniref:FAD-dependent oxidoreductase n=1 Tax=Sphingopyxis sp. JAI128 TaxID=2723066 RepID=UPI001612D196|nr:FAD-dependent oxidoreductase [Sphingopyxis sp. JAI128]MBB6426569.1 2-polyprenyl-6-methoxyphenol hydroxylase-like FAD-dependent oxidoreductase [Sphingopyxis sp. JAI128]
MKSDPPVIIVGGGPAGMVAGLLFARAGVPVTILEKHADFLRDFRGDTVHPSTLELFDEIGLLEELLKEPHAAIDTMTLHLLGQQYTIATMKHLPVAARFVAMMPQWDLLDFIAGQGRRYPTFDLRMSTEATGLIYDAGGRVSGVTLASGEVLPAWLVIAADGRRSVLRDAAELPLEDLGAPMDVLWFRVPVPAGMDMPEVALGTIDKGGMVVAIPRGDYWQCAQIIGKGGFAPIEAEGIEAFRQRMIEIAPGLAAGTDAIKSFGDVKLLSVALDRLTRWSRPGLLAIGDAAHAMSPVGGVGINLAVQDAVAAANILAARLAGGADPDPWLARVQARRWKPTVRMQALQRFAHRRIIEPMLRGEITRVPLAVHLLDRIPLLRRIPGRILGLGFGRQHVQSPLAKDFS